ncbi:DUF1302 family protein [Rhodovibrionaceae bacterium A322]
MTGSLFGGGPDSPPPRANKERTVKLSPAAGLVVVLCLLLTLLLTSPQQLIERLPDQVWTVFVGLVGISPAQAEDLKLPNNLSLNTVLESRLAVQTGDGEVQKAEALLTPEAVWDLEDSGSVTAILRLRGDLADKLEPGRPSQDGRAPATRRLLLGTHGDLELRELYWDQAFYDLPTGGLLSGEAYLRLGKQQVVWGEADGLKVLDRVNPQSFREFILPDFDESRIPLWTVNLEVPVDDDSLVQLLWIPDTTVDDIPEPGSAFAFTSPKLVPQAPPGVPVTLNSAQRPNNPLSDSDAGLRYSTFLGGWDLSLNYLYHYDDQPLFRQSLSSGGVTVTPEFERSHLIGGSFNKASGDWVFRGELGYATDRYVLTNNPASPDGYQKSGELSYVLGLDWSGLSDTLISGQVFQTYLSDHDGYMARDRLENQVTFLAEHKLDNETWTLNGQLIHSLNDGDGLARAKVIRQWTSTIELEGGLDYFYGSRNGLFGQFQDQSRLWAGVRVGL